MTAHLHVRRSPLRGPDHGALLLSQYGGRLRAQTLGKLIQKLSLRLGGRRVHPHLFTNSIAVHLLRGGADIRYVQAFLATNSSTPPRSTSASSPLTSAAPTSTPCPRWRS